MSEQIVAVLDNDRRAQREGTSRTGNLMIIGRKGSGKTVLAVDIVKAIQNKEIWNRVKLLLLQVNRWIEELAILSRSFAVERSSSKRLVSWIPEQSRNWMHWCQERPESFSLFLKIRENLWRELWQLIRISKKKFTSKLELPVFINDELVTFGQTYAKENGYKLDEMGILALYSRIDVMQREDHAVTVAEVKEIMDEAIKHSQKANVKHLARRVFGKSTDSSDRIILKEEDFKI